MQPPVPRGADGAPVAPTACGFARLHLQFDSPARLSGRHQTLIVTMAHLLKPLGIAPGLEGLKLVLLTTTLSFGVFEVVRRSVVLRPLFGPARLAAPVSE